MNNDNQSISFTTDILKSVSSNNDIPLELVKYSFDIMLRNLDNLVNETDATTISIPFLGNIYTNYKMLKLNKNLKEKKGEDTKTIDSKIKNIEDLCEKNKHNKNYRTNRHLQKKFIRNYFFSKGLSIPEIEKRQNETRE